MSPLYVMIRNGLSSNPPKHPGPPAHLQPIANSPRLYILPYKHTLTHATPAHINIPNPHHTLHHKHRCNHIPTPTWSIPSPQPQSPHAAPPPWILLGFKTSISGAQHAVYGPPGAEFDNAGNIYIPHEGGSKEYITPYRGYNGRVRDPPSPDEDCCGFCHWLGVRTDYYWMTTRDWGQAPGQVQGVGR